MVIVMSVGRSGRCRREASRGTAARSTLRRCWQRLATQSHASLATRPVEGSYALATPGHTAALRSGGDGRGGGERFATFSQNGRHASRAPEYRAELVSLRACRSLGPWPACVSGLCLRRNSRATRSRRLLELARHKVQAVTVGRACHASCARGRKARPLRAHHRSRWELASLQAVRRCAARPEARSPRLPGAAARG